MFHKSLRALPLYRFHKFTLQHSYRSCIQLCVYRKVITSSYCCTKAAGKSVVSEIKRLQTLLGCTFEEAERAYQVLKLSPDECKKMIEWLNENGATIAGIRDNTHLLRIPFGN